VSKGKLDDIPLYDKARNKAWEAFIKRKDVKKSGVYDEGFPLYGGYYELWCQAWGRAWENGFKQGYESGWASCELLTKKTKGKK
jgi:hypothetical protein